MAKLRIDKMSQNELESYKEQVIKEINELQNIVDASNSSVFTILINKIKEEMNQNVIEEEWKKLKENQKKIESYRSVLNNLQYQEDTLVEMKDRLDEIEDALNHYQRSIFDAENETPDETALGELVPEYTGFELEEIGDIETGDIFEIDTFETEVDKFVVVQKSREISGSYAIISNFFEGERCLQYPSNFKILENAKYVANIYKPEDDEFEKGLQILKTINLVQEEYAKEAAIKNASAPEGKL